MIIELPFGFPSEDIGITGELSMGGETEGSATGGAGSTTGTLGSGTTG
jgi:hypothetical protein